MNLSLQEIVSSVNGRVLHKGKEKFNKIYIDTRKIEKDSLFIAIKGDNFNGNQFVKNAINSGASICIVDQVCFDNGDEKDSTIILVEDTRKALLDLAGYYRRKLGLKIIGVTGSNGKTSTKDLIAAVLSTKYKVFKTKGNFNNEIGVPLMLFELDESYDAAVIEMGMSNLGEIHNLAKAARPDMAVITNIGISHIENLKTRQNILRAKMEITDFFDNNNLLIVNGSDDFLCNVESERFDIYKVGRGNSEYSIVDEEYTLDSTRFTTIIDGEKESFTIPLLGRHNIFNTLLALCVGRKMNVTAEDMRKGIPNLEATSMRLDTIKTDDLLIINDCYNSSPSSVKVALDFMENINDCRKVAILGTMKELGDESRNAHNEIGRYAKEKGIDMVLACGDYCEDIAEGFGNKNIIIYQDITELMSDLRNKIKQGDCILVKASRSMKFERITEELKAM